MDNEQQWHMTNPTPALIREIRHQTGLTQTQAAKLIGKSARAWQNWETNIGDMNHRKMDAALYELFLIKAQKLVDNPTQWV